MHPPVSIVTPVYNGEPFLAECIESIKRQTYDNWEYTIVNNCSTDKTLDVAYKYASQDKRITVVPCRTFLDVIGNHNRALGFVSSKSKYCKIVSADDWLFPEAIDRLVAVGEAYPSTGIVGSYTITGSELRWPGLPVKEECIPGRSICRLYLTSNYTFNAPSALLYRTAIVKGSNPFFPGSRCSADAAACLTVLRDWDFGFVHQILSFERVHEESITARLIEVNSFLLDRIEFLLNYSDEILSSTEIASRLEVLLDDYYKYLAVAAIHVKGQSFWRYHSDRLAAIGLEISKWKLAKATLSKVLDLGLNLKLTSDKLSVHFQDWIRGTRQRKQIAAIVSGEK